MANYFICLVVQRLILPLILAICCLLRPVGLSLPYLIFLLALPFVPVATPRSIKGSTGIYFKIYIAVSILLLLGQIAFQIVFVVLGYELIEQCQFTEILLRHVGLVKFEDLNASMVVYWIAPEIIMTLTSGIVYGVLKKLANGAIGEEVGPGTATSPTSLEAPEVLSLGCGVGGPNPVSREKLAFLTKLGVVLSVAMLCLAAVLQPSVPSGIYFVIFLGSATWWACYKELDRAFGVVLRITLVFLVVHITGFLAYQNPWPQELLPANGTLARIFSLTPILSSSCDNLTDIRNVNFESDLGSDYYLNPVVLLLCYYCISITSSLLLRPRLTEKELKRQELFYQLESGVRLHRQISFRMNRKNILRKTLTSDRWRGAARKVKLMRGGTRRVRDASSSDAQPSIQNDTIAMHTIGRKPISEEDDSTSFFEQIMLATGNVASFIYKNSYIFTNVIMMTWSIMYHSWLTFVLLIWANLIWIMPNQRKNMLNSSPFLVIYAELLLLAQYLYGMKLTDDELPSTVNITGINLAQIGFIKYRDYPSSPLLIKSLFTTMFWISLRQMIQEKQMERRTSAIADLAAPLQVTVGAATTGTAAGRPLEKKSSAFITRAGTLINSFLIKFWIWVVAITLFLSGMTGTRMTGFRIVYMALFLIFVLTFQFSFKVWRKMMYAFWLTVIVYSMAILVLVYTYQFDKFPLYWKEYLKISDTLQKDIGLQIYETKQLFLHLVNPTMIVIITVIQLHYCHKKFLEISEIPVIQDNEIPAISETSSAYGTFSKRKKMSNTTEAPPIEKDPESDHGDEAPTGKVKLPPTDDKDDDDNTSEILDDLRFRKLSKQEIKGVAQKLVNRVMQLTELVWLFAEIHLLKIILIVAFSLGVETVSFLHLLYVFMTVFAVKSHTNSLVLITRIMSLISSILLITTMMYQVEYIKEANFVSECPNIAANSTDMDMNNAKWFGFQKTDALSSLADLLRPYLIYIIVVTIHAVVVLRQTIRRIRLGQSPRTPHLMFPNVTRSDADKDIPRMIKYLFNYGFYKFGVEISLVSLISLIAYRMDVFSCLYAVWVCVMFHMTRDSLRKMWRFLTWFTVSLIPLQYVIFIGLPPALCVDYPWDIPFLDHFRIWAMLPENTEQFRSKAPKMVSDFLLLMFLCRQTLVFRIEARYNSCPDDFGGGSNKSVLDDIDKLGTVPFINPTPDFIAKVRNWLDISKRGIFLVFFWCTLAIVFLTGSSRVTLFSIGYLIGSFTFLWQGTDFYLRPIRAILKTWNMLIAYNVFVITTKTLLQMIGCLYLTTLTEKNCWLVQLLGVSCLSNPPVEEASTDPLVLAPTCKVPYSDSGLFWDGFCFAFLLVQRRIFSSHYFCHIINETKASTILASRGAELIEDLRIKDVKKEAERESQILQKIKMKMDRIKATQQKILEPVHDPTTHAKEQDQASLRTARTHSMSSYAGYHTPIEDEIAAGSMIIEGEGVSDIPSDNGALTVGRGSYHTQAPSPSSALMTVSLDAYLDPQRMSFESPNEMLGRVCSPDDTFPVFSPPPCEKEQQPAPTIQTPHTLMPPSKTAIQTRQHRRQSSLNTVSWPNPNELTVSPRQRRLSNNLTPAEDTTDQAPSPRSPRSPRSVTRHSHRRQSSMGTSVYAPDELTADPSRRRSSFLVSLFVDDDMTTRYDDVTTTGVSRKRSGRRPGSFWGPVGESGLRDSIRSAVSRSPVSHHEYPRRRPSLWRRISENRSAAIRSGDYYMFEDTEHEFELDLMQPRDSDEEFEKKGSAERRLSRRHLTLGKLYAKIKEHSEQEAAALHLAEGESSLTAAADPAEGTSTAGPVRHSSSPALGRRDSEKTTAGPPDHRTGTISEPIPRHTHFDVGSGKRKSDDDDEPDGQKPSTSKGTPRHQSSTDEEARLISDDDEEGDEEIDVEEATKGKAGKRSKFSFSGLTLVTAFLAGALGSLTLRLHRVSRSYRYVMKVLAKEKKILKETPGFGAGMRTGTSMIWTPIQGSLRSGSAHSGASSSSVKSRAGTPIPGRLALSRSSVHNSNSSLPRLAPASDQTQQQQPEQSPIQPQAPPTTPTQQQSPQEQQQPSSSPSPSSPKVSQCDHEQTPTSVVAHHHGGEPELPDEGKSTELIEGDKSPKDDVSEEDFASQEHSVIVEFLQAAWYAILSHTDFICYFLVFLNQVKSASLLSLPLPLMVTLWGTLTFPRPSKNFWVTLIAYTQTIVILKCVCQFDMLWWNQREIAPNQPFAPARIIGIEHKEGYATYDLALLLVLFCHRFILKSLGLWKSDFVDESEVSEGFYKLDTTDEKTKALIKAAQEVEKELFRFDFLTRLGDVLESSLIDMNDSDEHEFPQTSPGDVRRQRRERMIRFLGSRSDSLHVPLAYKLPLNHRYAAAKVLKTVDLEGRESLVIRQETTELSMVKVEEGTEQQQLDQQEPNGNGALVCVTHHAEEAGDYFPQIVKHSCLKYTDSVKAFFNQLLDRQSRKTADVYGYLFLCDFINFFVILFGFSAFGTQEGDGGVLSYFEENKVPMTFLLMLIIQFFLIVVDRALYLRKYMVGKILFQFFLIIGIHIWMFFVLPATTERSFNATNPPVYYYLIKCFYLLFSAYQIRCGYPARILGNFVTKGFTMINFTGFKLFMTIPFLFELRTLMDWIWTDTSMTLFDWLKMEDIFSNVYQLKCMRQLEEDLPAPRGQKKGSLVKYLMGGGMMLGIILLIWFPLALFAFSNAVGEPNLPYDVSVTLRIGPYEPVYVMSAQDSNIHGLNEDQWEQLLNNYSKSKTALTFLSNYESVDVAAVKLGANSTSIWNISPPDKERLLNDLNGTVTLTCRFRYTISRKSHSKENPGTVSEEKPYELRGDDPVRPALVQMLATDSNISVTLPYLMPKFLKVKNSGNVKPIHQLMDKVDSDDSFRNYRNITLRLFQTHQNNSVPLFWWEVKENCTDNSFVNMPYADCLSHLVMYMFNDKIFPSTISSIAAGGIIGIYSTLILVFSRMLRTSIFSGASSKIMFEDLPYVDRVLQLCLDIYLVRESLEFTLEEDLFAKLIFLYRSPETMIKWTRPKNEDGDDESDSMSTSSKSRKKND
ncbi:piezo-type mechanosensitive ion channel component isoform X6 [Culex pipiens pallens]|uniref:piezo-type mechanosensitive ion channel component isoform X6 n=1 Tax=Culex pipiens pallens TaxID=42434 RepID=UPI001954182E|nr:piezo-type mechanosensitive ion channel component isoform X6 [Culex pipiens pallens]